MITRNRLYGGVKPVSLNSSSLQCKFSPFPVSRGHFVVPFGRNESFVVRHAILDWLLPRICPQANEDDCQYTAIEGLGGIGKSQIALEAAYRLRDQCSIFWVPVVDAPTFENAYREIGHKLKVAGIERDGADVKNLVKQALNDDASGDWLLIVDNADDPELCSPKTGLFQYLPLNRNGSILLTTRTHAVVLGLDIAQDHVIKMDPMSRSEALELLHQGLTESQIGAPEYTTTLLDLLADLPLAIRQASAYMAQNGIPVAKYLELCESSDKAQITMLSKDFADRGRYKSVQNPIATTWSISFEQISRLNPHAVHYMGYMCSLAEKDIPETLLPVDDLQTAVEAMGMLKGYAFVSERAGADSYDIHRLVRLAMLNWLKKTERLQATIGYATGQLRELLPAPNKNAKLWKRYLPHVESLLRHRHYCKDDATKLLLLSAACKYHFFARDKRDNVDLLQEAIQLSERVVGKDCELTLDLRQCLVGRLMTSSGREAEAEHAATELRRLRERAPGGEHPNALDLITALVAKLMMQRDAEGAERVLRKVMAQPTTSPLNERTGYKTFQYNTLVKVLRNQRKHEEARQTLREAVVMGDRDTWWTHESATGTVHETAALLNYYGDYETAERILRQAIPCHVADLSAENWDILKSKSMLAVALNGQEKLAEAVSTMEEVEQVRRETFGVSDDVYRRDVAILTEWKTRQNEKDSGD